jgi:tetratricopeptide (TPR) repeat protein
MKIFLVTVLLVSVSLAPPLVQADQSDPRLDTLFLNLKKISNVRQAQYLSAAIRHIWSVYDSNEINDLYSKGDAAIHNQDYQSAISYFNRVIELAPDFAEAWNKRATVYYLMGNYQDSLADIVETLKLEPRHFGALSGRGLCYLELQKLYPALNAFEKALEVNPWLYDAYRNVKMIKRIINQQA